MTTKPKEEIQSRVSKIESKLKKIEAALSEELEKDFFVRDRYVFLFLDTEKKIYSNTLKELKWVLNE